jgi:hypothetical protein
VDFFSCGWTSSSDPSISSIYVAEKELNFERYVDITVVDSVTANTLKRLSSVIYVSGSYCFMFVRLA